MHWIGRGWRGEEKLWKVFWVYGPTGVLCLFSPLLVAASAIPAGVGTIVIMIVYAVLAVCFVIWLLVSEWRAVANSHQGIRALLVRIFVIYFTLQVYGGWIIAGASIAWAASDAAALRKYAPECRMKIKKIVDDAAAQNLSCESLDKYFQEYQPYIDRCTEDVNGRSRK